MPHSPDGLGTNVEIPVVRPPWASGEAAREYQKSLDTDTGSPSIQERGN
jgi:hypothetical protein